MCSILQRTAGKSDVTDCILPLSMLNLQNKERKAVKLKGDQQTSRALNRRLILNLLRRHATMSRVDIAAQTGLSSAAVTFVTTELMEEGLVVEGEAARGGGGRRPVPLSINFSSRLAIGMKLTSSALEAALCDLSTTALATLTEPIPDTRPETVVLHAAKAVRMLMPDPQERTERLIGIGLALPGSYDVDRGICTVMPRFGWENVPIADMLAREVDVPVWVDNDVNSFALAQHLFGQGQSHRQMMALAIGAGVGAAFITDGVLHRGARGMAGEIGHTIVAPDGRPCLCGRRGCLETYWSDVSLSADWAVHVAQHRQSNPDLAEAADAGDAAALALLHAAAIGLGTVLATAVGMIDPDVIIVGGEGVRFGEHLRAPMAARMDELAFKSRPDIIFDWHHDSWPRGAAALALQKFFNFEIAEGTAPSERP